MQLVLKAAIEDPSASRQDALNLKVVDAVAEMFANETVQASPLPVEKPAAGGRGAP